MDNKNLNTSLFPSLNLRIKRYVLMMASFFAIAILSSCNDKKTNPSSAESQDIENPIENNTAVFYSLPLKTGFYVLLTSDCENPANADWQYYSGKGLSESATKDCILKITKREGNKYTISQTCTNTYDKSRTETQSTIIIKDDSHFTLEKSEGTLEFKLCDKVPDWFKN